MPAQRKMGDGSRTVRVDWRYRDPQTGKWSEFHAGTPYKGPMDIEWLDHPQGPDGRGPLLVPEFVPEPPDAEQSTPSSDSADSSVKEKK